MSQKQTVLAALPVLPQPARAAPPSPRAPRHLPSTMPTSGSRRSLQGIPSRSDYMRQRRKVLAGRGSVAAPKKRTWYRFGLGQKPFLTTLSVALSPGHPMHRSDGSIDHFHLSRFHFCHLGFSCFSLCWLFRQLEFLSVCVSFRLTSSESCYSEGAPLQNTCQAFRKHICECTCPPSRQAKDGGFWHL